MTAALRVEVAPVGGYLYLEAFYPRGDGPEALADVPEVIRVRAQERFDLFRVRVRRGVQVRVSAAEQRVPHVSAYQVHFVPGLPESTAETLQRLGYAHAVHFGHHKYLDSSTNEPCV